MIDGLRGGGNGDYEKPVGPAERTKKMRRERNVESEKTGKTEYKS